MTFFQRHFLTSIISLGTLLEWAEYTFYGYMAITLSSLFFPTSDPQVGILKTYGIFAAGYLMRPLGAILFGHIGDKWGRKAALMLSLLLMGAATAGIGCLPTYETLGITAAAMLLVLRMAQGIAISGEYNGAGIFLIEKNRSSYPCLASSWVSASAAAGMVVGGIAAFITSLPYVPVWTWRVPFLLGGMSCFLGIWFRRNVIEPNAQTPSPRYPLLTVFQQYKKSMVFVAAIAAFTGIFVYIGNIYIVVFLKQYAQIPTHHATFFAIFGEILVAIFIPLCAFYADQSEPYRQYRRGLIGIALLFPGIFMLCATGSYLAITLAMLMYGILNGVVCGPMVKMLTDQFPASVRYTGISFGWSLSAAIFSGTAPMVAQYLVSQFSLLGPSLYVSVTALATYAIIRLTQSVKLPIRKVDKLNYIMSH